MLQRRDISKGQKSRLNCNTLHISIFMERQINIYSNMCTYLQIFEATDVGTNDLKIGINDFFLGPNI